MRLVLRSAAVIGLTVIVLVLAGCVGGGGGASSGGDRGAEMTLSLPKTLQLRIGQPSQLAISVTNSPGIAGADIEISYDPAVVSINSIGKGTMTQGFLVSGKADGGALRIHLAAADNAPKGAGTIVVAQISAAAGAKTGQVSPVRFQTAQAYDETTRPLNPKAFDGQIAILQ